MDRDYTIRRAKKSDAKGIYKVLLAAFEEYRHYYTPEGFSDTACYTTLCFHLISSILFKLG